MLHLLLHEVLYLSFQSAVFFDGLLNSCREILSVVEEFFQTRQQVLLHIDTLFCCLTGEGFDAANTSSYTALAHDAEQTETTGTLGMATAAELYTVAELYNTNFISIFLAKESDCAHTLGFFHRYVAMILQGNVLADATVDDLFNLTQFFRRHFLEVREVEAQIVGSNKRTLLFYMATENLAEGLIDEVSGRVVGFASTTRFEVDYCAEISCWIFGQLFC